MSKTKIRVVKRPLSGSVKNPGSAIEAMLRSDRAHVRELSRSVDEWVRERDENRDKEHGDARKAIRAWKEIAD